MQAEIISRTLLPEIPSASGIELVDDRIYIIGDDSPFLFILNKNLKVLEKIKLYNVIIDTRGKIPKAHKADLESLTKVAYNGTSSLLIIGSGSVRETRDVGFLVDLKDYSIQKI